MKILFVTPSYKPAYIYGGPTVSVSELAEALVANGHSVTVYTTTANGEAELNVALGVPILVDGVTVYYFRRQSGDHTHISYGLWRKLWISINRFDVVHLQSWWSILILGSASICRLKRHRYIVSPRGMLSSYSFLKQHSLPKKLIHLVIGKRLLKKSILHATTPLEWKDCQAVHRPWIGFILPNIVRFPQNYLPTNLQRDEKPFVLGFLSRIDPKKGLEVLFEALAKADDRLTLRIAGHGSAEYVASLKVLVAKLKLVERIEWCGWVGGEDKFDFLRSIDVFALISYNENFANTVVESLMVGTPVLLSDNVGLSDFVKENSLGWVCGMQVDSVAKSLNEILQQKEEVNKIRKTAPPFIEKMFNKMHLGNKYIKAYEEYG